MNKNKWNAIIAGLIVVSMLITVLVGCRGEPESEEPVARSYNTTVYTEQGGGKLVVASGGEIEVQSGGTLDIQSGATTDLSGGVDLDGALLDIDADGDTSIQADTDDQIDIEISAADDFQFTANTFTALSGSTIKANTIAETTAASGVTIDSAVVKDGGILAAGTGLIDTAGITDCLVIDSDGDTTLSAPTDDQIDIEISGADDFMFTANMFEVLAGSATKLNGTVLDLDADDDTSITADTDDQVDVEISGADDFQFTANTFTALSGSTIAANTIAETTAGTGVTIDSVLVKDGGVLAAGTGLIDTNGITDSLVIDADGDTTISAPTDDQIDIEISGADDFQFTANMFEVLAGSATKLNGTVLDLDADDDTSITADTDDQIDIEISGADDFQFTANTFTAQSGSSIVLASGSYPLGYGSSGQRAVYGTTDITGTGTASHGLTTVTFCLAVLGEDPTNGAGDSAHVTVAVSGNVCTLKAWQDDFVTAATEADTAVQWLVIGTP